MSYSDFTLGQVKKVFSLKMVEAVNIFAGLPVVESSASGTNWRFLKLLGNEVQIDLRDYYLSELTAILGILVNGIQIQLPAFT